MIQKIEKIISTLLPNPEIYFKHAGILSDTFTKKRDSLPVKYFTDSALLSAYCAYFLPINAAKVLHILNELKNCGLLKEKKVANVLDLGCGPGTASLAVAMFFSDNFSNTKVRITGIDGSLQAVQMAGSLYKTLRSDNISFVPLAATIDPNDIGKLIKGKKHDIIFAANFFNEVDRHAEILTNYLINESLTDDGLLIIMEPALREIVRPLMKLRDDLILNNCAFVCAPCLHQKSCPMLSKNERDWCHFYIEWKRPKIIEKMDNLTGLDHKYLKMAYMVFCKNKHLLPPASCLHPSHLWRVVSSPLPSKGKVELVVCGNNGELKKIYRLNKDRSPSNSDFDNVKRGDIVECEVEKRVRKEDTLKKGFYNAPA